MALWTYLWAWSDVTKWLYHLDGSANDSSWNGNNGNPLNVSRVDWKVGGGCALWAANPSISIPSTTMWTIWTGDFVISFWVNPNNPWGSRYPILFGSFATTSPFAWPTVFFDPSNSFWTWWDGIQFRCASTNLLNITSPSASSLYWVWTNIVFTRISWTMYVYYNWSLVGSKADTTNIPAAWQARIFSRNLSIQRFASAWAKFDECIVETWKWWTATEVKKYYTYALWRFTS